MESLATVTKGDGGFSSNSQLASSTQKRKKKTFKYTKIDTLPALKKKKMFYYFRF